MGNIWYLSPSNQAANIGAAGYGSEKKQMNLLLDEIIPHLDRAGVSFHRGDADITIQQRVKESNTMKARYHLALHSNAGGNGKARGPIGFYYNAEGKALSQRLTDALLALGQANNRAQNVTKNQTFYELKYPAATACLLEVDFHDNPAGVEFLTTRRSEIAEAIAKAIIETDGKEFVPVTTGEYVDEAVKLGLFSRDTPWDEPLTCEEAARLLVKLWNLWKRG